MLQSEHLKEITILKELLSDERKEAYFQFLEESCRSQRTNIIYITFPIDCNDPLRWFHHHSSSYSTQFYWEIPALSSVIATLGRSRTLSFEGADRFNLLENALQKVNSEIATFGVSENGRRLSPRWVGGFSFYPEFNSSVWEGFQPASFTLPELGMIREKERTTGFISLKVTKDTTPEELRYEITRRSLLFTPEYFENGYSAKPQAHKDNSAISEEIPNDEFQQWAGTIDNAKTMFRSGEMEKVVLTRKKQFLFNEPCNPVHSLFQLRQQHPDGCTFLIKYDHAPAFLGCSPELLLHTRNHSIETEALAGSIARGKTKAEDNRLSERLLASLKDQKEHNYVVQSIKKNLSPFLAEYESPVEPVIKKFPNVQHLYTPMKGEMKEDATILQMLEKLHPTPAVGGTPRASALSFIKNKEPFERGWFASPIGWITSSGQAKFYVAIRSGLVDEKQAVLFAGCGIVADSDPLAEWEEANLKFKPMLSVLNHE